MLDLNSLNPQQREAVCLFSGPMMILAGAGTGKTRVITARIAYMLQSGVSPQSIAAMTFTNKAAKEMKDRIGHLVGREQSKRLSISTFHSFCLQILRQWPKPAGIEPHFSLVGTSDQLDLVRRGLEEKGWAGLYKVEELLTQISLCKNWLISPQELLNTPNPPAAIRDPHLVAAVYELYERQLRLNRAIDFDDCIFKVVQLLREKPIYKEKLEQRYRYILVDEFQDTNASQFAVLEEIAGGHQNICVVGDDDQSIYSWRGAMYETLERFEKTFRGTTIVKLEQNYRCSNVILNAANAVIKNNSRRKSKTLWSDSSVDTPLVLAAFEDAVEEARWVAERCMGLVGAGHALRDIAILYRANAQAKLLEMSLREAALHYKTFGGQSFFERQEVRDFMAYLRLILRPTDHLALWRIVNTPTRGIGLKTQEAIEALALEQQGAPFEMMSRIQTEPAIAMLFPGRSAEAVSDFVKNIQELQSLPLTTPDNVLELGEKIISTFQLAEHIKQNSKNVLSRQRKIENLRSLPHWLKRTAEDYEKEHGALDAGKLVDALTLSEGPSIEKEDEQKNYISLMTIHASKGLEFPAVFIIGLEEGSLPHKNSLESPEGIPEERRLFYVALTRAKLKCHLSYALMRQTGFQKEIRQKSRFLKELPEGFVPVDPIPRSVEDIVQIRKEKTLSKLAQLRESLQSN